MLLGSIICGGETWSIGYWAAISYWLAFIALSRLGGVYFVGTHDAFGLKAGNQLLPMKYEVTFVLYICSVLWSFLWLISKNDTAS